MYIVMQNDMSYTKRKILKTNIEEISKRYSEILGFNSSAV